MTDSATHPNETAAKTEDVNETEMHAVSNDAENEKDDDGDVMDDSTSTECIDVAVSLGLGPHDRVEVKWDVMVNDVSSVHWWGATLLEYDGRTKEGVAIRKIRYDPFGPGGFPDSSEEDVIFMGRHALMSHPSEDSLEYRLESGIWVDDDGIEQVVNNILEGAMQKVSARFDTLSPAQKSAVASKVAKQKERLIELIHEHVASKKEAGDTRPLTADDVMTLFARMSSQS